MTEPTAAVEDPPLQEMSSSSSSSDDTDIADPPTQALEEVKGDSEAATVTTKEEERPTRAATPPSTSSSSPLSRRNSSSPKIQKALAPKRTTSAGEVVLAMMDDDFGETMNGDGDSNKTSTPTKSASSPNSPRNSPIMLAPIIRRLSKPPSPSKETLLTSSAGTSSESPAIVTNETNSSAQAEFDGADYSQDVADDYSVHQLEDLNDEKSQEDIHVFEDDEENQQSKRKLFEAVDDSNSIVDDASPSNEEAPLQDVQLDYGEPVEEAKESPDVDDPNETKTTSLRNKKRLLMGCGFLVFLALGGAGAAVYMLLFHESNNAAPTESPTISPAPTTSPAPSSTPSASPTMAPTISPQPTQMPSGAPSTSPSASPSSGPTMTMRPSSSPTAAPSATPTRSPQPSSAPSSAPTSDFRTVLESFLRDGYGLDISTGTAPAFAMDWILDELHDSNAPSISLTNQMLQRFALVTLEMSLQEDLNSGQRQLLVPEIATKNQDECDWKGVKCNGDGEIIKVDWSNQDGWNGSIPKEIRLFFSLQHLDLSNNRIGGKIPEDLYTLTDLTHLYLYKNRISGTISTRIGQLDKIVRLHLSHNNLSGSIPQEIESDAGSENGIRPLVYFNVYLNQLTGSIPNNLRWRQLQYFDVGRNEMTGTLPKDLGEQFVALRHLHLDHNHFRGTLPSSYNSVGNGRLESLTINHNILTGVVPGQREMYNKLVHYTLQENQFASLEPENCNMLIPRGEMPEFKADCDICQCDDFFNICSRYCGAVDIGAGGGGGV